jgi:endo-1,3(4)-beta-glucanase
MARMAFLLLACARLSLVYSRAAGDAKPELSDLEEREVAVPPDLQPTISYSSAIRSLQSVTISVLPSITGVRTTPLRFSQSHKDVD